MASKACCAAGAPVVPVAEYTRKGMIVTIDNLDVYTVGSGDRAIVAIYDVFGFEFPQVFQVCDRLAAGGFTVVAPDVFHGKPWPASKWPPKPEDKFFEWCMDDGGWEKIKPDLVKVLDYLQLNGAKKFGIVGFCWGTFIAFSASQSETFSAVAGCHPSLFGQDKPMAEALTCPAALLSTKDDPLETVKEVLDTKPFGKKCFYKRYNDQEHGFMAARGDWEKPEVNAAATDALGHLIKFFSDNLKPCKFAKWFHK